MRSIDSGRATGRWVASNDLKMKLISGEPVAGGPGARGACEADESVDERFVNRLFDELDDENVSSDLEVGLAGGFTLVKSRRSWLDRENDRAPIRSFMSFELFESDEEEAAGPPGGLVE